MNQFTVGQQIWIIFGAIALGVTLFATVAIVLSVVHDIRHPPDEGVCEACRSADVSSDRYGKVAKSLCPVCNRWVP